MHENFRQQNCREAHATLMPKTYLEQTMETSQDGSHSDLDILPGRCLHTGREPNHRNLNTLKPLAGKREPIALMHSFVSKG